RSSCGARSCAPCRRSSVRACAKSPIPSCAPAWSRLPLELPLRAARLRFPMRPRQPYPRSRELSEQMKVRTLLACAMAAIAIAGCKKTETQGTVVNNDTVTITEATPPPGGTWADVTNKTAAGFMMGNPKAKVKLIEIGALTCPHCREFDETGVPELINKYVKSGQVSWEFRPYLLNGLDVPANLIASCHGAT